jgi:hypothetical protein
MASPGSLSTFDVLAGTGSLFSAYSSMIAADEKAAQREFEIEQKRKDQQLQSEADRLQARQKQEEINERLDDTIAQQKAIQAQSGASVSGGSAEAVRESAVESATEAKQRVATNFALNRLERQSRIGQLKINEEFVPDQIEARGQQQALQGLSNFAMRRGLQKRNAQIESDKIKDSEVAFSDPIFGGGEDDGYTMRGSFGGGGYNGLT